MDCLAVLAAGDEHEDGDLAPPFRVFARPTQPMLLVSFAPEAQENMYVSGTWGIFNGLNTLFRRGRMTGM